MGRRWARGRLAAVAVTSVLLAGCSALGGTQSQAPPAGEAGAPTPVRVSIMPTTDLAPLHLADRNGWFAEEGLRVETVTVPSGQASIQALIGGDVDIAYSSYAPFFIALDKGAADFRFVADASSLAPDTSVVVTMRDSGIGTVADLAGKRIAVTATGSISDALVKSAMRESGVDFSGVQWVSIPFPDTPAALERGDVDAAFLTEPFLTLAERGVGAVAVVDTSTGPATGLPTAGYASLAGFSEQNPQTVAAFRRVLQRAVDAAEDRALVNPLLVEHSKVDPETAAAATLLDFHAEPRADQLQRVPDLLLEFGVIGKRIDVASMIAPVDG